MLAGDLEVAERELRADADALERVGETGILAARYREWEELAAELEAAGGEA